MSSKRKIKVLGGHYGLHVCIIKISGEIPVGVTVQEIIAVIGISSVVDNLLKLFTGTPFRTRSHCRPVAVTQVMWRRPWTTETVGKLSSVVGRRRCSLPGAVSVSGDCGSHCCADRTVRIGAVCGRSLKELTEQACSHRVFRLIRGCVNRTALSDRDGAIL